jgi:hypothetical protein
LKKLGSKCEETLKHRQNRYGARMPPVGVG